MSTGGSDLAQETGATFPNSSSDRVASHNVQFYTHENVLLADVGRFVASALVDGSGAVVVATPAHLESLSQFLSDGGLDVSLAAEQGRYVALDAAETLSRFMVNDLPDAGRFNDVIGEVLSRVRTRVDSPAPMAVFGEMVALLWQDRKVEAAIQLEKLWNDLARTHSFRLRCAYPFGGFNDEESGKYFLEICAAHTHVIPEDGYNATKSEKDRLQNIASIEQKVEVLESEVDVLEGEVALRDSEERFRHLVEAVRDYAIFMLDTDGRITTWNQGAERIKGYTATEIIGQHFSRFYPEEDVRVGKPQIELEAALRDGRVEDEGWRVRKDGSKFWATVVVTAMTDDAGNHIGFSKVTKDNTERMLVLKALRDSRLELHDSEDSLRRLSLHLLRTQDEERRRIGRDLHDSLGQALSVLKMKLDSISASIGSSGRDALNQNITACASLSEDCIKEVRTIAYLLYPPMLEEMGLRSAISWYLDGFSKRSGIRTTFDIASDFVRLPRHVETAIFRVLQESLTNVHRHSGSQVARVRLFNRSGAIVLEVVDEGKGMPAQYLAESEKDQLHVLGVGLRGMEERMRQLGGGLELRSSLRGTTLVASVPVEAPSMIAASSV
jgi:PAS domain S-box-containing protein